MLGLIRPLAVTLVLTSLLRSPCRGQEPQEASPEGAALGVGAAILGGDLPEPFVPLNPRTAADRDRIEALQEYLAARSLEDQGRLRPAIDLLEGALKKDPDSVAILRRLARLCDASGRIEDGMKYARRVVDLDPSDTQAIGLVVKHHFLRDDLPGAEAFLKAVLENPKLDRDAPGAALLRRDLGFLYADSLNQPDRAADQFAEVVAYLEADRPAPLSEADVRMVLGEGREADALTKMGAVLYRARRFDRAVEAFRRSLDYADDPAPPTRFLAMALKEAGRPAEALEILQPLLERGDQGRESYELLADTLSALGRQGEVLPRLEEAARVHPGNVALQYLLADRYREAGRKEEADALYQHLLATRPDPTGVANRAAALLKEGRTEDLIAALGSASGRQDTAEAIRPLIESIALDPQASDRILDAGLTLQEADPPKLDDDARKVLAEIALKAGKVEKILPIQKLVLERSPNPQLYLEFWNDLYRSKRYDEAAAALDRMIERFPDRKDAQILTVLGQTRMLADQPEGALRAIEESLALDPMAQDGLGLKAILLARLGRKDEAFGVYEALMRQFPDDPEAQLRAGDLLARLGHDDEAIAHYRRMIDRFGGNPAVVKNARLMLSLVYSNLERFDEAEQQLEILYEAEPDDPHINNDLGYMWADRGKNLDRAEAMIRKAVAEEPENPSYLDSLGWVLHRLGRHQDALAPLEKAARGRVSDATIYDHLGDVQFKLRDFEGARDAWTRAEKAAEQADPPDKRLPEIRRKLQTLEMLDDLGPAPDDAAQP